MTRVLFVCMGNICRSPMAEGVFRKLVEEEGQLDIEVDSAGTHGYHAGDPPDPRAVAAAERRGINIATLRARKVSDSDFDDYDIVVAMDRNNYSLLAHRYRQSAGRLSLFMKYAGKRDADVPDPYYGGQRGFEHALDLIERGARGLLKDIHRRL